MDERKAPKTTELIDELLQREDPALVGVKKILSKRRGAVSEDSSFRSHTPEVFQTPTAEKSEENTTIFTDEQKRVVELERELIELNSLLEGKENEKNIAVEEAYAAGIEEGRRVQEEIAREQFEAELREIGQAADSSLLELIQRDLAEREAYFTSLTDDLLKVTFAVAKQVVNREVTQDKTIVSSVVRKALFYIADKRGVEIRVNPEDRDRVQELIDAFKSDGERFTSVSVTADGSISAGGCLIETAAGIVDAQIERQLEEIETEVTRAWHDMSTQEEDLSGPSQF